MKKEIILNDTTIQVESYQHELHNGLNQITVHFKVTSKEYHDIAVLLYEGTFDVKVPKQSLNFRGTIHEYATSITNLYEENQVGDYHLTLIEVSH